ncbi:YafY family transcriptional regulator [Amycolatopsis sp. NBC_00345]|uniref:helix-turn-helix transcriptional regulator n=1 Tax=Amycolatopsis sp. NBC_00345 TaxID=2975955 RepID=UPI002E2666E6
MISTSARLLRLVSLLSARPSWTNRELGERMEVTDRTIRRDIAKLRELGYGIESGPGPWGGYRLVGGAKVPPLSLDDEEALAVAVALREAALSGVLGGDQAALSALLKLRNLLPQRVAARLGELDDAFVHTSRTDAGQVSPGVLLELASACRKGERLRLSYRDMRGRDSVRDVDPHRLVRTRHRWYLVALDVARGNWRTFRADRVTDSHPTGTRTELDDPPDAAALVAHMLLRDYPLYTTIRVPLGLDDARGLVPPHRGSHQPDGPAVTLVTIGGTDPDQLAGYLLSLASPLRILSPDSVREALHRRVRELLDPDDV